MNAQPVAAVDDLRVHFHTSRGVVRAVDGVSFQVKESEVLGLVGETGCGKSVTARSLLRLLPSPPAEYVGGRILFSTPGRGVVDLLTLSDEEIRGIRGDRIAMIFQDPSKALNPAMPVGRQVGEVFLQHRADHLLERAGVGLEELDPVSRGLLSRAAGQRSRAPERPLLRLPHLRGRWRRIRAALDESVAQALADTRIPTPLKIMRSYPHELSGGMKQRVMIAQALACDPDLLIADEPTTALDVTIQARILDLIRELQQRRRTAVLYITHDLSLVRRLCDRVTVMYAGRIAERAGTGDVFGRPLHPYTRGLLGAMPARAGRDGRLVAIRGSVSEVLNGDPGCRFAPRCPHAGAVCRRRDPALVAHGEPGHEAACFLHEHLDDVAPGERPSPEPVR